MRERLQATSSLKSARHPHEGVWRLGAASLLCWLAADATLHACPICFRVEESATTDGVQAAVLVLVSVTTVVLGACGAFAIRFARRDAREAPGTTSSGPQISRSPNALRFPDPRSPDS